ncbi:MAG: class I SAM-dependent methyltransferase [Anaerolineaceae bacterium]|nr:class I SAM-dependent methyltransferase [Anaerolineaceae bacterium]
MANNIHFDFLAPLYERFIRPPDAARLSGLLELPGDGWMLDAGGGTGRVASLLCPLVERLVISDLSFPMAQQASGKGCVLPTQARVERLPFADDRFDRILVVDAFHHFGDQPGALSELVRVLAPGGRLVIEEPDIRRFAVKLIALAELLALMNSRFRSPAQIRAMAAAHGLDARVEIDGPTAWIIAVKPPNGSQP